MTKTTGAADGPERLRDAARLFEQRNAMYGGNYVLFGEVAQAMLPDGLTVSTPEQWRRAALFVHMLTKLTRYAQAMQRGRGHQDSLDDFAVCDMMQAECDDLAGAVAQPPADDRTPEPSPSIDLDFADLRARIIDRWELGGTPETISREDKVPLWVVQQVIGARLARLSGAVAPAPVADRAGSDLRFTGAALSDEERPS